MPCMFHSFRRLEARSSKTCCPRLDDRSRFRLLTPGWLPPSRNALLRSGLRRSVVSFLAEPLRQPHGFLEFFSREWFASDLLVDELVETGQRTVSLVEDPMDANGGLEVLHRDLD